MPVYDARSALVVVDVQNDFADPNGSLYVQGGEEVVPIVNDQVAAARAAGALVVYTQDWHPAETPHFVTSGGAWPPHCVQGTWGAELHPDLAVEGDIVQKGTGGEDGYSGFTVRDPESGDTEATVLDGLLRSAGVEQVVVVGLAADVCVKDTALDAARLGYRTTVLRDGVRAVELHEGDAARAFQDLVAAGVELE